MTDLVSRIEDLEKEKEFQETKGEGNSELSNPERSEKGSILESIKNKGKDLINKVTTFIDGDTQSAKTLKDC